MAARKFGTGGNEEATWAINVVAPTHVADRYRQSRIVAFSTGCVYPLVTPVQGGCSEAVLPAPVGEYAQSALGRERVFGWASRERGTPVCLFRLNYAGHYVRLAAEITDANGAIFDVANGFRGCIPGIHEVLRRQGLLEGTWCLRADFVLSPGQAQEIDRIQAAYPHLNDDAFVRDGLAKWLGGRP